ncbi:E3 SUMO-protein ligase ZBED1-like [Bombina bombina]|uniref:E3 SUMO-protein ligase ZBED1-like n=1 Tax=Bombina bombina TaxID=8345 RepID=UPI00235A7496|nr:E3 SUMO-protein ligase ZBED1-like [Bombina bombina]
MSTLIANMVAKDMLPLSFVEGEGFWELIKYVEPKYTVPARKTITTRLEKMHVDSASSVRNTLAKVETAALTTDAWTALTTESYVTITCHFIKDGKMKSVVLQTRAMPERHTAENLANVLNTAVDHWDLRGKITACVHDNASNIVLANSALEWESNPCFAHTLQLAVNNGIKLGVIQHVVGAASRLVSHFHHSTTATQALKMKQKQQSLPEHCLVQYCRTRWNSIYDMFKRLLELRWAVVAVLSDRVYTMLTDTRTLDLADDSWVAIEELPPVLSSLKCATTALCRESEVSISMIYPVTATLLSKHLISTTGESTKVSQFKTTVLESLKRRFSPTGTEELHNVAIIASFLDPRHKHLKFTEDTVKKAVTDKVAELLYLTENGGDVTEGEPSTVVSGPPEKQRRTVTAMATLFGDDYYTEDEMSLQTELDKYMQDECIPPFEDPLAWWKANECKYRKLSRLAKAYLCISATSVPAERVFSAAGLIVNRLRNSLLPEHVDMLIFLNKNNTYNKNNMGIAK